MSEDIFQMNTSEFSDLQETLFHKDDQVRLILLLDTLTKKAVDSWRGTKGATDPEIETVRDQELLPAIQKIGYLCLGAVRFHNEIIYCEGIERLQRIHDLGKIHDARNPQDFAHHPTLPSNHSLVQLYIVGGYVAYRRRVRYLRPLFAMQVNDYRSTPALVLRNPHLARWFSGDSDPSRFEGSLKLILDTPPLLELFLNDKDAVLKSLCEFDFLACVSARQHKERQFPYFTNYPKSNLNLIVEQLLEGMGEQVFALYNRSQLAEFLISEEVGEGYQRGRWHAGDWSSVIQEFLKNAKQEGNKL